jgi:hypothetical protein
MSQDTNIRNLWNFVSCQIVANESFEASKDYIVSNFNTHLNAKYIDNGNREQKKKIEKLKAEELKKFMDVIDRYVKMTTRMVKSFDDWHMADKVNEKVEHLYNALDDVE